MEKIKVNAANRLLASNLFRYACPFRPPAIGAVPRGYTQYEPNVPDVPAARHGVISYPHKLSDSEVKQYELVPLGTSGHPLVLPKVPPAILSKVEEALSTLRYVEEECKDKSYDKASVQDDIDDAYKVVDIFKKYLTSKHLNVNQAIEELGGIPKV